MSPISRTTRPTRSPSAAARSRPPPAAKSRRSAAPTEAFEAPASASAAAKKRGLLATPLWSSPQPQRVGKHALTFSFDAEIPTEDAVRLLRADRSGNAQLEAVLKPFIVDAAQLKTWFQLTAKQVLAFALRKGAAPKELTRIPITLLNPRYLGAALLLLKQDNRSLGPPIMQAMEKLRELVTEAAARQGLKVASHLDSGVVELTHPSSESIPVEFGATVQKLMAAAPHAMTHLHLGVPTVVPVEQTRVIGMAIEARLVLDRLGVTPELNADLAYKSTLFDQGYNLSIGVRGMVKVQANAFKEPVLSHDLEIRQWNSIAHGMQLLAMATEMAAAHERIGAVKVGKPAFIDPQFGPVSDALAFAAKALARSADPRIQPIAAQLAAFAKEAKSDAAQTLVTRRLVTGTEETRSELTADLKTRIHEFLNEQQVDQLLTAEAFLEPRAEAPHTAEWS